MRGAALGTLTLMPCAKPSVFHARGVAVHVTLNTLVYAAELGGLADAVRAVAAAGADAVIVDDLATAQLVRSIAPGLRLHGSTQMSIHTAEGAKMLAKLGYSRAILARELSLAEIEAAEAGMPGLAELERIAAETVEKIPIRIGDDPEF